MKFTNRLVDVLLIVGIVLVVSVMTSWLGALKSSRGIIVDAERMLKLGQVYECVTPLVRVDSDSDDGNWWYAIVKAEDKYFGLRFKYSPPLKGVVAKQQGTIVFIQIASADSGVTIPNPLSAENQAE